MRSGYRYPLQMQPFPILSKFCAVAVCPYLFVMSFVFVYFLYQKYRIRAEIRNVPFSTILRIDLDKVKKNLQITSMTYNFVLTLSFLEIFTAVGLGIESVRIYDMHFSITNSVNISTSCVIRDPWLLYYGGVNHIIFDGIVNLNFVVLNLIPAVVNLFLIILRRTFFNLPYKRWIKKYLAYFALRFVLILSLSSFLLTCYMSQLFYFPFAVIDFLIYLSCSKSFYILLKGRRNEARIHSSQKEFLDKSRIVVRFFWARIFFITQSVLLVFLYWVSFVRIPISILGNNPCYLTYISFSLFPTFNIAPPIQTKLALISSYCTSIELLIAIVCFLLQFLAYSIVSIGIIVDLVNKRRRFNLVNDRITRPLMENYRATLQSRHRNCNQRPRFIQFVRSLSIRV